MPRTKDGKYVTEASKTLQNGDIAWRAGKYDEARKDYQKSVKLYNQSSDLEGEAFALSRLGEFEMSLNNNDKALDLFDLAAGYLKNSEESQILYVEVLLKKAKAYAAKEKIKEAFKALKATEDAAKEIHDNDILGEAYDYEAYLYLLENKEEEAAAAYRKAINCFKHDRIGIKEASTLRALARLEMKNRKYDVAHDLLERCRDLYRENGDLLGEASALSAIGTLRYIIRDIENARKALMKSVYLYGKVSHHFAEAEALLYLARVEAVDREKGDFERARGHYKRSIELFNFLENETMKKAVLDEYQAFLERVGEK